MRVIRRGEQKVVPWRNGRGQTIEIAIHPLDSTLADFEWRVSSAAVDEDGPFSLFPGVDRTLILLEGRGLLLEGAGAHPVRLETPFAMHHFAGDSAVIGRVPFGPVTDLNIMTRRDRWTHTVVLGAGKLEATLFVALEESIVCGDGATVQLAPGDAALPEGPVAVDGLVAAITLMRRAKS